jgi:hypothetical protein
MSNVHLDRLAAHPSGADGTVDGCDDEDFPAAYAVVEPQYAAAAGREG